MAEPVIDNDFIIELQKTKNILKDNERFVSDHSPTRDSSLHLLNIFQTKLNKYYKKLDILLCKTKKYFKSESTFMQLVQRNNYYIFDDFTITPEFTKYKDDALDSLIYSPFSINFFSLSFKDIFEKYFTGIEPIPVNLDELITIFINPINEKLQQNMKFCPLYIQQIFNEGFNHGRSYQNSPNDIFHTKIIEKMFENPHLFKILNYTQQMTAKQNDLNRIKDVLHDHLFVERGVFTSKEHFDPLPKKLKSINNEINSSLNPSLLIFEKLLICSRKIPFQIPEELLTSNFSDQIKYLLVDENDEHYSEQIVYFEDVKEDLKKPKFRKVLKESLKEIQFQVTFSKFKKGAENVIGALNIYLKTRDANIKKNVPMQEIVRQSLFKIYLENPQLYVNDLICFYDEKETELGNSYDEDDNNSIDVSILTGTLEPTNKDAFFLVTRLLSGSSLKKFKECRPELQNADRYFENKIECQRDGNTINVSQSLVDYYKSDYDSFTNLANQFSAAFSSAKDPYNMMTDIENAYTSIKKEIFGSDGISDDDEEKNFIINLFNLVRPPNILSTFVYIYDYLFSSQSKKNVFDKVFKKNKDANYHYKPAEKVLKTYVLHICQSDEDIFNIADLCRSCKFGVELVLPRNKENLQKLAAIIALNKMEEKSYSLMFNNLLEKPLLRNEPAQFTFRVYQKNGDFANIWICNVTNLSDKNFDVLVYDNLQSLVDSLERIYDESNHLNG